MKRDYGAARLFLEMSLILILGASLIFFSTQNTEFAAYLILFSIGVRLQIDSISRMFP